MAFGGQFEGFQFVKMSLDPAGFGRFQPTSNKSLLISKTGRLLYYMEGFLAI